MGEHIKKKRLELKLTQTQAGEQLSVKSWILLTWEKGKATPPIPHLPAIHRFLGYDPYPPPTTTIGERLIAKRRQEGWSQRYCAKILGVDPTALSGWEKGETIFYRKHRIKAAQCLGICEEEVVSVMSEQWGRGHRRKVGSQKRLLPLLVDLISWWPLCGR